MPAAVTRAASANHFARLPLARFTQSSGAPVGADVGGDHLQAGVGVAQKRKRAMLGRIEKLRVERDDSLAVVLEQSPGAGREILQARPHRENDIRLLGQSVCGRGAVNADRAHVERMVGRER